MRTAAVEAVSRLHLYSGDTYVAFTVASKEDALRAELGRELEAGDLVVGLGDGGADVPMLKGCGLGIYVGPPRDDLEGLAWTRAEGVEGSRGVIEALVAARRRGATASGALASLAPLLRGGDPPARADLTRPFAPILAVDKDGTLTEKHARVADDTAAVLAEHLASSRIVVITSNETDEVIENLLEPICAAAGSPRDVDRLVALTGNGLRRTVFARGGFETASRPGRMDPGAEALCFSLLASAFHEALATAGLPLEPPPQRAGAGAETVVRVFDDWVARHEAVLGRPRLKRWPSGDLATLETDQGAPLVRGRILREVERIARELLGR